MNEKQTAAAEEGLSVGIIMALYFISRSGLATVDQLAESLKYDFSVAQIEEIVACIVRREFVAEAQPAIKNPCSKVILYPTRSGFNRLLKGNRKMAKFAIAGRPDIEQIEAAEKALLISESLVVINRDYKIVRFFSRRELSKNGVAEEIKSFNISAEIPASDYANLDCEYLVILQHRSSNLLQLKVCKIAVKQKIRHLYRADKNIVWFAASKSQAEKIAQTTDEEMFVLDHIGQNRWIKLNHQTEMLMLERKTRTVCTTLNKSDSAILDLLERSKMTLSMNELITFICKNTDTSKGCYTKLCNSRVKLLHIGLVKMREAKVRPGFGTGAPPHYLYLPENEKHFVGKCFQRHVVLSHLSSVMHREGWKIVSFDPAIPALTMLQNGRQQTFLSDFADQENDSSVEATVEKYNEYAAANFYPTVLAVVDYPRYYEILKKLPSTSVINLCDEFDQYD